MPARTDELQYVTLNDFRAGIYSRSYGGLGSVAVPAPLGAAQVTNTFRCIALSSGGLAPLPKQVKTWTRTAPDTSITSGPWITGFYVHSPVIYSPASAYGAEGFLAIEYLKADGRHHRLYRLQFFNNAGMTIDTLKSIDSADVTAIATFSGQQFAASRINSTDHTLPGVPLIVTSWRDISAGGSSYVSVFPDPAAPTLTQMANLATGRIGQVIAHQNRIILLEGVFYDHGAGGATSPTNEQISFTDPPNSNTLGSQNEVFVQENPVGYGAWGSISAGELLLIKDGGGAVHVIGDVADPAIVRLPGVVSTAGAHTEAVSTPKGLFYCSNQSGAYTWRGADTSDKISEQLDDNTFNPTAPFLSFAARLAALGDWVLFPFNYLYDTLSNSWWRIDDPSLESIIWWNTAINGIHLYGAPVSFVDASTPIVYTWDKSVPAVSFSWQSHPIPETIGRFVEVREVECLVQGTGTVTITLTAVDGTTSAVAFSPSSNSRPVRFRKAFGIKGYTVIVRIQSDGGAGAAPVVYEVSLGYAQRERVAAA